MDPTHRFNLVAAENFLLLATKATASQPAETCLQAAPCRHSTALLQHELATLRKTNGFHNGHTPRTFAGDRAVSGTTFPHSHVNPPTHVTPRPADEMSSCFLLVTGEADSTRRFYHLWPPPPPPSIITRSAKKPEQPYLVVCLVHFIRTCHQLSSYRLHCMQNAIHTSKYFILPYKLSFTLFTPSLTQFLFSEMLNSALIRWLEQRFDTK
jgi:hypothetical protein